VTTLTARVVRRADMGVVTDLPLSRERHWLDQLNEPGSGSVIVQADDPALAAVADGDVVQFLLDGTVAFAYLVRAREHVAIDPSEASGQITTLSGPGLLAVLDEAVVYPSPGLDSQPVQETRLFSWPAFDYDDSSWTTAVELADVGGTTRGATMPPGPLNDTSSITYWADTNITEYQDMSAWFIWADVSATPGPFAGVSPLEAAPGGTCYFRKRFTVPAGAVALQFGVLFDEAGQLFLDGMSLSEGDYGTEPNINTFNGSVPISPGEHELAAVVTNDFEDPGDVSHNPGALAAYAIAVDASGGTVGPFPTVHTDSTWLMLPYPATPPGVTPGKALRTVVTEGQARGALGGVTMDFTDTADSEGVAWPVVGDISTAVGNDVLAFARELAETYLDVWLDPATLVLRAWVQDGRGVTRDVELHPVTDAADPMSGNVRTLTHRRAV
jgi:hypothetical protein